MSGTSGTQASTKGETTSSKSSKSGYDHLDINKLYKGKSTEPVAKAVTQKHGMQTLGKAPPARRGGSTAVKSESTTSDVANSSAPSQPSSLPPNIGQTPLHPPGWSNSNLPHPPGPPSPHNAPSVPTTGPAMHDKNWSGGPDRKGNFPSPAVQDSMQRFAQEFPSLDSGGDTGKGPANASGTSNAGHQQMSKNNQDNQYGPGPILRPQTEGSWTQGGGRGMPRPPGPPPPSNASTREFGPERPNLGGPTPPPMSVGQGGHPPPPLGAFQMQFPSRPPYMYPNAGGPPPGPGGFYPPGPGMRFGMPIPPGAPPPPSSHPPEGPREPRREREPRGPPPRPASHFASKPIIKQEELERMDELGAQDGGWATVQDDIDYNKRISFSDDEGEDKGKENASGRGIPKGDRSTPRQDLDRRDDDRDRESRRVKILERQQPPPMNDRNEREPRDRDSRYESDREPLSGRFEYENEDDWKRKPAPGFDQKERGEPRDRGDRERDRDRVPARGRMREEESWRSGSNNRFQEEDSRVKKGPAPLNRADPRGGGPQFQCNLPPRLQRQHQQPPMFAQQGNQRKTPSPVPTSGSGNAVNKERDYRDRDRDREWDRDRERERDRPTFKILERNRGDSESSKDSSRDMRDRRFGNSNDNDSGRMRDKDPSKRLSSDSGRFKDDEQDSKASPKDKESDSVDNYHIDSRNKDDAKASFRSKPPSGFTSSWADEVDDDEYNSREDDDGRKGSIRESITSHLKRDQVYPEERRQRDGPTVPRRVIIQQTKVENMRSDVKPEPVVEPKPEPVKIEKPVEKPKSTPWGDRDAMREKPKTDSDVTQKDGTPPKENDRDQEKDQSYQKSSKAESSNVNDTKGETKEDSERPQGGLERKGSREKIDRDRHFDRFGRDNRFDDRRQEKSNMSDQNRNDNRGGGNLRDNRPKPRRVDSYESKRDNRTPDRDQYSGGNKNSSSNEGSTTSVVSGRNSQEKEQEKSKTIEKSRSGDRLDSFKEKSSTDKSENNDFRREREFDKEKEYDRHNRNERDDYDSQRDGRGHRGGRGRERGGYGGIYQPRGGSRGSDWGSDSKSRNRGRGNSRDFYDSKPKRVEPEREEKPFNKEEPTRPTEPENVKDKPQEKTSDSGHKGSAEDLGNKKRENKEGSQAAAGGDKKQAGNKSPGTSRRNARGGARLQGYGPPSDKNPFSTNQSHKDEEPREKPAESQASTKTGPVPLMALGDISPPNLQSKSRHHGSSGRDAPGNRGRGVGPRMQRDDYNSFRGDQRGGGSKRGTGRSGDAKPLMSINSNDVEENKWESGSDSGEDESKRGGGQQQSRKEGSGHQGSQEGVQQSGASDASEQVDSESGKKNATSKQTLEKSANSSSGPKNVRQETKPSLKDRRVKNQPYDPRPNSSKTFAPRFFSSSKEAIPHTSSTNNHGQPFIGKSSDEQGPSVGTWDKNTVSQSQPKESVAQPVSQQPSSATPPSMDIKDTQDSKLSTASTLHQASSAVSNTSMLDNTASAPVKTMIFENTNYKSSINSNSIKPSSKPIEPKKDGLPTNIEIGKDLQLGFGKVVEDSSEIDFNSFNDGTSVTVNSQQQNQSVSNQQTSKPMAIGQSARPYVSHQPSPISPQAADLNEKVQSVKRIWDISPMPSVAEQSSVCGSEDNSFHGGFSADSFKGSDNSREFSTSLQQPTSGYAPGSSPALSAISKPESSSSPTSSNLRIAKPQQQNSMDNQGQSGISSSPFGGYSMPQGSNAFGGMPAVPSPPSASVMYGTSQTLHATAPASGMYQAFSHVDAPVIGANRQYQQYPTQAATSGHYGLFLSTHTPMDYQSMSSYQHQHQQGSQGPPGQAPSQNSRISPGPMTTSGGGNSAGVIISSTSSLMNMKQQTATGSHPSMPHQVVPGTQQGYSQLSHHHPAAALSHPQHHLGAVGPAKGGYSQSGLATASQTPVFIPFDPNQPSMIGLGQNFLSSAMRSGPPGGPPPPATPPVQALQASSTYYSGSSGNQSGVYPTGSNQGSSLQQLHVAVAPNPQGLPGLHNANPQFGLQYPTQLNLQGYNQQAAASTVSALNLSNQLIRNPGPGSHSFMKQPGIDLVQQSQLKSTHDPNMMNQNTWNSGFALSNQNFHGGNKTGTNPDRNAGNNIGNQRKGNSHAGNVPNMKYMTNQGPGGYSGQVQQP